MYIIIIYIQYNYMDLEKHVTFVTLYDNQYVKCYFGCYFNVIIVTLYMLIHDFIILV